MPFVLPLRNAFYARKLNKLGFGNSKFDADWNYQEMRFFEPEEKQERLKSIEVIQNQVAKDGLSESYFESGPQALGCIEEP